MVEVTHIPWRLKRLLLVPIVVFFAGLLLGYWVVEGAGFDGLAVLPFVLFFFIGLVIFYFVSSVRLSVKYVRLCKAESIDEGAVGKASWTMGFVVIGAALFFGEILFPFLVGGRLFPLFNTSVGNNILTVLGYPAVILFLIIMLTTVFTTRRKYYNTAQVRQTR